MTVFLIITLTLVLYAAVRAMWRSIPMAAGTGELLDTVWRRHGRFVAPSDSGRSPFSIAAFLCGIADRIVPLRADSMSVVLTVCHIVAAGLIYGAAVLISDSRSALCALVCYLILTSRPHSWSYVSISSEVSAVAVACAVIAAAFFVGQGPDIRPFAVVMVLVSAVHLATRKLSVRATLGLVAPFFAMSVPVWAFASAGILEYGGWHSASAIVAVAVFAASLLICALTGPAGFIAIMPVVSLFAGIAFGRVLFSPYMFTVSPAHIIAVVWAATYTYVVVTHASRRSPEWISVTSISASDAVVARDCGNYIERSAVTGSTVLNATSISALFFYAPGMSVVGRSAWGKNGADEVPAGLQELVGKVRPDIIVTDETRCSILALLDDDIRDYRLAKVFDGRIAVFVRPRVLSARQIAVLHPTSPALAIVVVAHNRADLTRRCLSSIRRSVGIPYELVVVDNASSDGTSEMTDIIGGATLVRLEKNRGYAAAVNAGVASLRNDGPVLLLHNDVVLTEKSVERMTEIMGRTGADLVGPVSNVARRPQYIKTEPFRNIMELERFATDLCRRNVGRSQVTDTLGGFCMLVNRSTFDSVGGFSKDFCGLMYGDADFCLRVAQRDARMIVARDVFVMHNGMAGWIEQATDPVDVFTRSIERFSGKWNLMPDCGLPLDIRIAGLRNHAADLLGSDNSIGSLKTLVEAAELKPHDAGVMNDIGAVLWTLGEHDEAVEQFRRAVDLEPGLESAVANLADAVGNDEPRLTVARRLSALDMAI